MIKKILILCIFMTQQLFAERCASPVQTKFKVVEVSEAEMNSALSNKQNGQKVVKRSLESRSKEDVDEVVKEVVRHNNYTHTPQNNYWGNLSFSSGSSGSEAALIIFAVVGLVVVVMWIPYFPIMAYRAFADDNDMCFINHLSVHGLSINASSGPLNEERSGSLWGGRYSTYLRKKGESEFLTNGLNFELGRYQFDESSFKVGREKNFEGSYFLIGPSMLFGKDPHGSISETDLFGKIDLLGGTSFDGNIGLVSKAEFTLNTSIRNNFTFGAGIGGLYLDVKTARGLISDVNNVSVFYSGNIGYFF